MTSCMTLAYFDTIVLKVQGIQGFCRVLGLYGGEGCFHMEAGSEELLQIWGALHLIFSRVTARPRPRHNP